MLPTFDRAAFHRVYDPDNYGSAFACEMIELFIETTSPFLPALDAALDAHDASEVGRLLHQLKGSAGSMGAASLVQLCSQFEGLEHRTVSSTIIAQSIREAYLDLVAALREEQVHLSCKEKALPS